MTHRNPIGEPLSVLETNEPSLDQAYYPVVLFGHKLKFGNCQRLTVKLSFRAQAFLNTDKNAAMAGLVYQSNDYGS